MRPPSTIAGFYSPVIADVIRNQPRLSKEEIVVGFKFCIDFIAVKVLTFASVTNLLTYTMDKKKSPIPTSRIPKYFRPTSNVGFKKIFGTAGNESLVLQLLNSIIDDVTVVSFERLDTTRPVSSETSIIYDLYCKCSNGEYVIVEMQKNGGSRLFIDRALFYSARALMDQAGPNWKYRLHRLYFIGILDYNHFPDSIEPITKVSLRRASDGKIMTDKLLQIFVELPKFAAKVGRDSPSGERFLCALRDIGKADERPSEFEGEDLDQFFRASSYTNLNDEEKDKYDKEMSTKEEVDEYYQDLISEAREKAHHEGLAEGREEVRTETALKLKSMGLAVELIAEATGLSVEEITALK